MKKIGWIEISSRKYGRVLYEEQVKEVLAKNFDLEVKTIRNKYFKRGYWRAPEILFGLLKIRGKKDVWIRDSYSALTLPFDLTRGRKVVIVHHVGSLLEKMTNWILKKADALVTISEYWQNYLLEKGSKNVYKICNCFDLDQFNVSESAVAEFKKRHHLEGKPIVYLGNCQKAKGVEEAYQALQDLNVHLVTSGEKFCQIPAINLNLDYSDYLKLLKASTIVLTMSKFEEGWCRTAHEAMLLKTPVIGSGLGGMRELLAGGKQIICPEFSSLRERVEYLLDQPAAREKIGEAGFNFTKNFTQERFEKEWLNLIKELAQ